LVIDNTLSATEEVTMGNAETILTMLDRMLHESTSDIDREQTIEGLRRKLHGALPSSVLIGTNDDSQQAWAYETEINELREQLVAVGQRNTELETSVLALTAQLKPQPINGNYTLEQFMAALARRMGRTYGWRTDYVIATKETPGAVKAETTTIQQWQTKRLVPAEYYDQIDRLNFPKRPGKPGQEWSTEDYDFLVELYLKNPAEQNSVLAETCAERFGRPITENSIRGALDRLRKRDHRIPMRRPGREKKIA
jgi:hypothetical protein